jgi:hypothetical protein
MTDIRKDLETAAVAMADFEGGSIFRETLLNAIAALDAIELAYGLLWRCAVDRRTADGRRIYLARQALLGQLDRDGQARGIDAAQALMHSRSKEPEGKAATGSIGWPSSPRSPSITPAPRRWRRSARSTARRPSTSGRGNAGKRRSRASTRCFRSKCSPKLRKKCFIGHQKVVRASSRRAR